MNCFDLMEEGDLVADGLAGAMVGVLLTVDREGCCRRRVAYDITRVLELLMQDGMDEDEALEFFEFNIAGAYVGPQTPVFLDLRW